MSPLSLALLSAVVFRQDGGEIILPAPAGAHPVGVATFTWTDSARVDSLMPSPELRRVLGRIWYPARQAASAARAPYAEHLNAASNEWTAVHSRVRAHAQLRPAFAEGIGPVPVIVLAPGRSTATFDYTLLAEGLASSGYVVVGVDSRHHSKVVLPDGTLAPIRFPAMGPATYPSGFDSAQAPMNQLVVADLRFAFRQLGLLDRTDSILRGHLDLSQVGLFGHSNGGMAGSRACALEAICRAMFSVEGMQTRELRLGGVDKPYGLLYSEQTLAFDTLGVFTEMRLHARGPFLLYRVSGVGHNSITDLLLIRPALFSYPIDARRGAEVSRRVAQGFFDRFLRGRGGADTLALAFREVKLDRFGRP